MKKIALLFLFALSFCFFLSAQEGKIDWGPKYDHKGFYDLIGKSGDHIFVAHLGRSIRANNPNLKIFKFDLNKEIKAEYNLKDIIGKKNRLIDLQATEETIFALVFNEENKKAQFIEKLEINPNTMKVISSEKLHSFKEKFEFIPEGYLRTTFSSSKRTLNYLNSSSGNKMALIIKNEKERFIKKRIIVLDRNNFYKEINELELKIDDDKETESIIDYFLREDGSINLLKKHYYNKHRNDKHKKKPDYHFELIRKPLEGVKTTLKIKDKELFLNGAKITDDDEGNTYFVALYEREYEKGAEGTALYKIDADNKLVLEIKHRSTLLKKEKDKLSKSLWITNFFKSGDKYIVMYREQATSNMGTRSIYHIRNKAVIEAFNDRGEFLWTNSIHQQTIQQNHSVCLDYITHFSNRQIMIFANFHKANLEKLNHEDPWSRKLPNNDNVITQIIINLEGEMKFIPLCEPWEIFIGPGSTKVIGNQVYIIGFQEKFDNLRLGTIPLK